MEDLFNEELVQKLYEDAFPVKNIDPNLDWKMTRVVTATVKVYDNNGSEYDILIYDTNPLEDNSRATLLCKSEPTTLNSFSTRFDCPSYLNELFVCKRDTAGRVVAHMVSILNNSVSTTFGETASTRAFSTRAGGSLIQPYTPPQSESEILGMAKGAKKIKSNTRVKAGEVWKISQGDIFRNDFRVESNPSNPATIIIQGTWRPGGNISAIQTGANIVVTSTGRIELPNGRADNKSLNLNGNSTLTVYPGGYVGGQDGKKQGYIVMPTGSDGRVNYNAGTIMVNTIDMRRGNSHFYNCGDLDIDELLISDQGGKLTNMGQATIGTTTTSSTIENGCFLRVTKNLCGNLLMDNSCAAVLASYGKKEENGNYPNSNKTIRLGHQSMITIEGDAYFAYGTQVQGPNRGEALFRINNIRSLNGFTHRGGMVYYEVNKVSVESDLEKATFMHYLLNSQGTLARWGEAPIRIEPDQCTGEGNKPADEGKPTPEEPLSYTYVFEDNYPLVGDYDFNDVVIDVVPSYQRERGTNRIKRIQLDITLAAAGASKNVGIGLRLVGIQKNQIASVRSGGADSRFQESMRSKYSRFNFNASSLREDSDPSVVIPIAGEVHEVFGVNYGQLVNTSEGTTAKAYTYEIILELNDQTRTEPVLTKDNLDFFICYQYKSMSQRMEVHLYEFWKYGATAAGTIQKLNLDLAGNNTWAVCVPYGFRYPKEYVNISRTDTPNECAYPEFINWARNREVCQDWYKHPNEGYVMR